MTARRALRAIAEAAFALVMLVAIWLPTVIVSHAGSPPMIVVNAALSVALVCCLAPRRRQRRSRRSMRRRLPRA